VFSFGVMVLEIVTGKKNIDCYTSRQSEDLLTLVSAENVFLVTFYRSRSTRFSIRSSFD
jgi:hypothetical protein